MAAAAMGEKERAEMELQVAVILCDLKRMLRARDRRRRRRMRRQQQLLLEEEEEQAPVVPSWGRRRLRSVLEPSAAAAEMDGAASPDTPLAFPDRDSVAAEEEDDAGRRKARAQDEWVQEQRVVVASLSQEKADLLKQIEEYRARLLTSTSANESLKQLHKVREQEEHARKMRMLALRPGTTTTVIPNPRHRPVAALGLDLNEPADDEAEAARARAMAAQAQVQAQAQAQRVRHWQVQQLHRAAATAEARRRRLEILRAKVASPLISSSCKTRRVVG